MQKYRLVPGQVLWYCNRNTGELGTVEVMYVFRGGFIIQYNGKFYEMKQEALGTRLFFSKKGASCPGEIIKPENLYEFHGFELDDEEIQEPYFDDPYRYNVDMYF